MMVKKPGVFFFKIFFSALFLSACGSNNQQEGPHAQTCFLPANKGVLELEKTSPEPVTLNAGNEKLLNDITHPTLIKKVLVSMKDQHHPATDLNRQLAGEVNEGVVCLRLYNSEQDFAITFLQNLLNVYQHEKNLEVQKADYARKKVIEKNITEYESLAHVLEDSMNILMNDPLALDIEEPVGRRVMTTRKRLQTVLERLMSIKREKDELAASIDRNTFMLYITERPHYLK